MRAKPAAGLLLLLLALLLGIRATRQTAIEEKTGNGSRSAAGGAGVAELASPDAAEADSKSAGRKTLRERLPPGVKLHADEMRAASAKGNVRLSMPNGSEWWADRMIAGTEKGTYLLEGRVTIWTNDRMGCLSSVDGSLTLKTEGDNLIVRSAEGVELRKFLKPQSEEEMAALRGALEEEARKLEVEE